MKLISLSGPCGSGKTTLIEILKPNYDFVNSIYKNSDGAQLDPTLYISKMDYVKKWFDEVCVHHNNGKFLIVSDRSPFDSLAYLKVGQSKFKQLLNNNFSKLKHLGIDHYPILITAEKEILRRRIQERHVSGTSSVIEYEQELNLLEKSLLFFEETTRINTLIIDTSNETPLESYLKLRNYVNQISKSIT
ncbi:hypothetical protein GM921_09695 [Pedobacter sp. LMG 31464]|uniref:AAA domain-containing protein n=1 Tax=Pedobacter planticolens TaxID=2679964 RepID=A0A923DXB6_9SPHI|nr:hypothetical protein [Pedobacter planticolens]MBB2145759.1 hypothetical protein [Pedobacter planticolens]